MVLVMIAKMETAEERCKRRKFVTAGIVPVDERIIGMAVRSIRPEVE